MKARPGQAVHSGAGLCRGLRAGSPESWATWLMPRARTKTPSACANSPGSSSSISKLRWIAMSSSVRRCSARSKARVCGFMSKSVAQEMILRGRGEIIDVCAVQGGQSRPGIAPCTASKGAMKMSTRGMAIGWGLGASTSTGWGRAASRPSATPSWRPTHSSASGRRVARPAGAGAMSRTRVAPLDFWPARPRPSSLAISSGSTAASPPHSEFQGEIS